MSEHSAEKDAATDAWQRVSDALQPYTGCQSENHDGRSCPAVIAVMQALGALDRTEHATALQDGEIVGPIDEWGGYQRGELAATHVRTLTEFPAHAGEWRTRPLPPAECPSCSGLGGDSSGPCFDCQGGLV